MPVRLGFVAVSALALAACEGPAGEGVESGGMVEQAEPVAATVEGPERAVRIGLDGPGFDACGGYGEVTDLFPDGELPRPVRAAPEGDAKVIDRLAKGAGVQMCDHQNGFTGIVYAPADDAVIDCGTGSPVAEEQDYDGPCRSGWVAEEYITLLAG